MVGRRSKNAGKAKTLRKKTHLLTIINTDHQYAPSLKQNTLQTIKAKPQGNSDKFWQNSLAAIITTRLRWSTASKLQVMIGSCIRIIFHIFYLWKRLNFSLTHLCSLNFHSVDFSVWSWCMGMGMGMVWVWVLYRLSMVKGAVPKYPETKDFCTLFILRVCGWLDVPAGNFQSSNSNFQPFPMRATWAPGQLHFRQFLSCRRTWGRPGIPGQPRVGQLLPPVGQLLGNWANFVKFRLNVNSPSTSMSLQLAA